MIRSGAYAAAMLASLMLATVPVVGQAVGAPIGLWPGDYVIGAWQLYRSRFVDQTGRVIDNVNGGISHSEGQGYGMLLAVAADDRETFDAIWRWTQDNLMVRGDGLAAWKWDPEADPHVEDTNNATDGDLLIAWALVRARLAWKDDAYLDAARQIARTISEELVEDTRFGPVLLPGLVGFDAESREDGPVVNLAYWIFPALSDLGLVEPDFPSRDLIASGLSLLGKAKFGPSGLPANWIATGGDTLAPAPGFDAVFGYDAIRIPLYLGWYTDKRSDLLEPYENAWSGPDGFAIHEVDLTSGEPVGAMTDPGYHAIVDLVRCSRQTLATARQIRDFAPTDYYPSTLHLLSLLAMAERYPQCLIDPS